MEASKDVEMAEPTSRSIVKRDGSKQAFDRNKILERVKSLAYGLNERYVTYDEVIDKVATGLYDGKYL